MSAKRFRIAFSFAGEKRPFVAKVARLLAEHFGKRAILYDRFHKAEFARDDLVSHLTKLYRNESGLIVAVLCPDYDKKGWCGLEWKTIRGLLKQGKQNEIMLTRFGRVEPEALEGLAGYVDLDDETPESTTALILERLALNEGPPGEHFESAATQGGERAHVSIPSTLRLVSNKESVARGEVSILAIIETLLAIALVFYLSAHFNTLRWLAVAMCVSPLLLLRTDESTRLGIEWFDRIGKWIDKHVKSGSLPWLAFPFGLGIGAFVIRIGATFASVIREPASIVQAIPKNWVRVNLAMDGFFAPEPVPEHPLTLDVPLEVFREECMKGRRLAAGCMVASLFIPIFFPALIYRWSLKATSIIYAPLVFVAHSTFSESADLRTKLELIKRGDLSRIRVWYGVIAIAAFVVKLVLMMNLPGFAEWWNGHPVSRFLALYIAPAEIPKWQLAELANSVLAISAMLFARRALLRYELRRPWPEVPVKRLLGFVSGLRWVLALYAILCTGYITMRAAQHLHWPALGEGWLP